MAVGRRGRGELEDGGGGERDAARRYHVSECLGRYGTHAAPEMRNLRDAMRDDGVVDVVSGILELRAFLV